MTGKDILNEIGLKAYAEPLSNIRNLPVWPSLSDPLRVAILLIDFDTELTMNGLLGFLTNSSGAYLDQTIEAFRLLGARQPAAALCEVRDAMIKYGVTHQRLRDPHQHMTEYQTISFSEPHGFSLDQFVDEVSRLEDSLYADQSREQTWILLEAYLQQRASEVNEELARMGA